MARQVPPWLLAALDQGTAEADEVLAALTAGFRLTARRDGELTALADTADLLVRYDHGEIASLLLIAIRDRARQP